MRISVWDSDVCSNYRLPGRRAADLPGRGRDRRPKLPLVLDPARRTLRRHRDPHRLARAPRLPATARRTRPAQCHARRGCRRMKHEAQDAIDAVLAVDRLVHEPARLAILTVLGGAELVEFGFLETVCRLSKGNLPSPLSRQTR